MSQICIGMRREDKSDFERRAPLTPDDIQELRTHHGIDFVVEPSPVRIYPDEEYARAGATLSADLSGCDLIVGIKEVPIPRLVPGKPHLFFSHTVKGQPYNMPLLKKILEQNITLLDYELVTDPEGRRLIAFSYQAGQAGMINSLWSLGQRLRAKGVETPFAGLQQAIRYDEGLAEAKQEIRAVGEFIREHGLPEDVAPVIVGITGEGRVAGGAEDVLLAMQPVDLRPEELLDPEIRSKLSRHQVYKVNIQMHHFLEQKNGGLFDFLEYVEHPELYRSVFEKFLPHLTVMLNGIYWDERYPKLVTRQHVKQLFDQGDPKLQVIGDVTCDVEGSVETTLKATLPDRPVFVYNPATEAAEDGFSGDGLQMMTVDILPSEIPKVSSISFGSMLKPHLAAVASADYTADYDDLELPSSFKRAVIAHRGELAPPFGYLAEALNQYS